MTFHFSLRTGSRPSGLVLGLIAAAAHELCGAQQPAPGPRPEVPPARALSTAGQEAAQLLQQQGRHWQARGNTTLAANAWQRLLVLRPREPEALYGMAWAGFAGNRPAEAQAYVARLKSVPGGMAFVERLAQDNALADKGPALQHARQLVREGKADEAVAAYRTLLASNRPTGPVAVEFYNALGSTLDGWDEAREGFARLVAAFPADNSLALAYAQHLTYADVGRREGIKRLAALAELPGVGKEATVSWRKALDWLTQVPSDMPYLRAYLQLHPDDQALRTTLEELAKATEAGAFQQIEPDPVLTKSEQAYRAFQAGRLEAAGAGFEEVLRQRPQYARALGGLGLVRVRQQRFAEAAQLLARARGSGKSGEGANWDNALKSARYWALYQEAQTARTSGDAVSALVLLTQAHAVDPLEPATDTARGAIHAGQEDYREAAADYRRALALRKGDPAALRGLLGVLVQDGRIEDAQTLISQLSETEKAEMGDMGEIRAKLSAAQGRSAMARGDASQALANFAQALRDNPGDIWTRLAIARLLRAEGRPKEAALLMEGQPALAADAPPAALAAAKYAQALFDADLGRWESVRQGLEDVPLAVRTPEMAPLLAQATVRSRLDAATLADARLSHSEATALRAAAARAALGSPELELMVAIAVVETGGHSAAGYPATFLPAMDTPVGMQIQYASVLFAAQQDEQAERVLGRLDGLALSASQREGVDALRTGSAVRAAYRLLDAKDVPGAHAVLAVAWARHPENSAVLLAQAAILIRSGRPDDALRIYNNALMDAPQDTRLLLGAAESADAAGNPSAAQFMERAVASASDDPRVLAAAGRYYRRTGRTERAEQLLTAAILVDAGKRARSRQTEADPLIRSVPQSAIDAQPPPGPVMRRMSWPLGGQSTGMESSFAPFLMLPVVDTEPGVENADPAESLNDLRSAPVAPAGRLLDPWVRPVPAALSPQERLDLQAELDTVRFERSPVVSTGLIVRSRRGESGLSRLTDVQTPVEARWTQGEARLLLRVTPTRLNAGLPDPLASGDRFGTGAFAGTTGGGSPVQQRDGGIGAAVGYERADMQADIGTTPIGFRHVDVVGGVKVMRTIDQAWSWSGELSRRAVTDSVLSFASARDGRSSVEWGGVTATGGRLQTGWDQGSWGLYGFGALHTLRGPGVADNARVEAGGASTAISGRQPTAG
ncbi:tetratricopeptide repeat protein [Xylophilus ampelinus]|uniref:Tetratricopeptide repeat protein n=1 Tax=Xylophilus ampelinus TaxID=54067 RepID=A0A318SHB4_9BURK|nr:tetratricopeptide repeat protein [Xylophilus ampelinus]